MTCKEAKESLVLVAYGELSPQQQAELDLHLHTCPECQVELQRIEAFGRVFAAEILPEVSPNLLARSRMLLDERLDDLPAESVLVRLGRALQSTWHSLQSAPALSTLLLGVGFLSGNALHRYQAAHQPLPQPTVVLPGATDGTITGISSVAQTGQPDVVQVTYNRMVPQVVQGRMEDPQIRQLLMTAAERGTESQVRADSVSLLASECRAGHRCEDLGDGKGFRDALLVSLRYDRSPAVRIKALEGLQPYIAQDSRVRDAVLESLMRDGSADVRKRAIGMLEPVQADSSVRQVLHHVSTQDENPYIRNVSMQALEGVDGIQ